MKLCCRVVALGELIRSRSAELEDLETKNAHSNTWWIETPGYGIGKRVIG